MLRLYNASINYGYVSGIRQITSPYFTERPSASLPTLLVIHNISLPPNQYGNGFVEHLFSGQLDTTTHPYFSTIEDLQVSCHFFLARDGELVQFVSCDKSAWHAGESTFEGRNKCNDFSIGIEMEGTDEEAFTAIQYQILAQLTLLISRYYPIKNIVGHSDIAPERKTDPGPFFDWDQYTQLMRKEGCEKD